MAIIEGIEVTVIVNGQELREYYDEDAGLGSKTSVSKYIEATSGAVFAIRTSSPSYSFSSDAVGMEIFLDGTRVQRGLQSNKQATSGQFRYGSWNRIYNGVRRYDDSGWEVRPFTFAEIAILKGSASPPAPAGMCGRVADLGTIAVKGFRKTILGKKIPNSWNDLGNAGSEINVAERELKGKNVTHSTSLGQIRSSKPASMYRTVYVDGEDRPFATFTFKYRSRMALQNLLLIPRTTSPPCEPTPMPLEERNIEDLTPEEMRELLRRQQAKARMERHANVKSEKGVKRESGIKSKHGIKRERDEEYEGILASASERRARTRPFTRGEVIELD